MTELPRRALMRTAIGAGAALPALSLAHRVFAGSAPPIALPRAPICTIANVNPIVLDTPRALKLTWNANAICTVGVPVAVAKGYFKQHNLDVELINFGGSTDQLLEAIATSKADAGVGMALRWLKPLESGFDVKIGLGIHGGCMRLFAAGNGGTIRTLADLRGKRIGVTDMAAPDRNFFSIQLAKAGVDLTSIEWKTYPGDVLSVALQKGEIDAFTLGDPLGWILRDRDGLYEVSNNLVGEYAHRTCCVLGLRGSLLRDDKQAAAALVQAFLQAEQFVAANPDEAAAIFAPYAPKANPVQLAAMLRSHTHQHNPLGADLREQIGLYAADLKGVDVLKPSTDPARYAARVTVDVFA